MSIFSEDKRAEELNEAGILTNRFFQLIKYKGTEINYRKKQHEYAMAIMNAIKENKTLLIEAPVGIGKSYGYLIPIFYSINSSKKFNKVIISTSTMTLQDQLLKSANEVSKMLGINLKVEVVKGIGNYACLKKISNLSSKQKKMLAKEGININEMFKRIKDSDTALRKEVLEVADSIWKEIALESRGECSRCSYKLKCPHYNLENNRLSAADIVIMNHNYLSSYLNRESTIKEDAIIVDEAHLLEEAIRGINISEITYDYLKSFIYDEQILREVLDLFRKIRNSANRSFNRNKIVKAELLDKKDLEQLEFTVTKSIINLLNNTIKDLNNYISTLKKDNRNSKGKLSEKTVLQIEKIEEFVNVLNDMSKKSNSENVYWVSFIEKDKIKIGYVKKNLQPITKKLFSTPSVVLTSATMTNLNGSYSKIKKDLYVPEWNETVKPIEPIFDYQTRTAIYCDDNINNTYNYSTTYVALLAERIDQIIRKTRGRSLILFTSKKIMKSVGEILKEKDKINPYGFNLIFQDQEGKSNDEIQKMFENDPTKACLFGTAFWEGLDIKGSKLCNVIITKLPYQVPTPIEKYKSSLQEEDYYFAKMISKLLQGCGRLIRGSKDFGTIFILDPRATNQKIKKYLSLYPQSDSIEDAVNIINDHTPGRKPKNI